MKQTGFDLMQYGMLICLVLALSGDELVAQKKSADDKKPVAIKEGYYKCRGRDPGGALYTCIATVKKHDEIYVVQWYLGGIMNGAGMISGDSLVVGWAAQGGVQRGVTTYKIADGELTGRYAVVPSVGLPAEGKLHDEVLRFWTPFDDEREF